MWTELHSRHRWAMTFKDAHAYGNAVYTCLFEKERDELKLDRNRLNDSQWADPRFCNGNNWHLDKRLNEDTVCCDFHILSLTLSLSLSLIRLAHNHYLLSLFLSSCHVMHPTILCSAAQGLVKAASVSCLIPRM